MASLAILPDDPAPQVAGEIILVPVVEVAVGERLRPIDTAWANALGNIIAREGQQTPIEICRLPGKPGWQLVAGAHRLTGAQAIGMELIEAREVSSSIQYRKMREASENLWRKGLDPIGRAAHVAELVRLHKLRIGIDPVADGRAASANARWQKAVRTEATDANATIAAAYGWAPEIADGLGLSRRTIEYDLMLYRRLPAGVIARLRDARHAILGNAAQLRALAKLDGPMLGDVVERLVSGGAKTAAQAIALARGGKAKSSDPEAKRLSAFIGAFQRMSLAEKKGALAHLADLLPAGYLITTGGDAAVQPFIALINDQLGQDYDPAWIIARLCDEHGAIHRFARGTEELKLAKVTATCTAGGTGLLRAWTNAAERRLASTVQA